VIAEDLVAREPWEHAHIDRFRRALQMLNVPDPDTVIADRLAGQGPFIATDPFMAAESLSGEPQQPILVPYVAPRDAPVREPEQPAQPAPERDPQPPEPPVDEPPSAVPPRRDPEPDIPLRRRAEPKPPAPAAAKNRGGPDIDLTDVLSELESMTTPGTPASAPTEPQDLDDVFGARRKELSRQAVVQEAAEQLGLAKTYLEMGMADEAIAALTRAVKAPTHRFEAASLLGRLYVKKRDLPHAVEWLERAAAAPPPSEKEGHRLMYELGAVLEATGEVSRALAVFLELQADAGEYRDVAARVDRLARVQAGG
jgi:hypothetical protein